MKKRMIASLLLITFLFTSVGINQIFAAATKNSNDAKGHWSESIINELVKDGIVTGVLENGVTKYYPEKEMTRAEFVSAIIRSKKYKLNIVKALKKFTDVKEKDWYKESIDIAYSNDVLSGYPDGTFRPNGTITRSEIAAIMARVNGWGESFVDDGITSDFLDVKKDAWYYSAVMLCKRYGIISGYQGGSFKPHAHTKRAEAFSVLKKDLDLSKTEKIPAVTPSVSPEGSGHSDNDNQTKPIIGNISPNKGAFGTVITIEGANFSPTTENNEITFLGRNGQTFKVEPSTATGTKLEVVMPLIEAGVANFYLTVSGKNTSHVSFTVEAMTVPKGDETLKTIDAVDGLLDNLISEIGNANDHAGSQNANLFLPDDAQAELNEHLQELNTKLSSAMTKLNQLPQEEKDIINKVMASDAISGSLKDLNIAAEILSHSTSGEALDNIESTKAKIQSITNNIIIIRRTLMATGIAIEAGSLAADLFGGSGAAGHVVAAQIFSIIYDIIDPIIDVLHGIIFTLELAPSRAVEDTLVTYQYTNTVGIDQYFGAMTTKYKDSVSDNIKRNLVKLHQSALVMKAGYEDFIDPNRISASQQEMIMDCFGNYTYIPKMDLIIARLNALNIKGQSDPQSLYTHKSETLAELDFCQDEYDLLLEKLEAGRDELYDEIDSLAIWIAYLQLECLPVSAETRTKFREFKELKAYAEIYINKMLPKVEKRLEAVYANLDQEYSEVRSTDEGAEDESSYFTVPTTGMILLNEPYYLRGHIDFTADVDEAEMINTGLDSTIGNGLTSMAVEFMSSIVDLDLNIDTENVDVKLKLFSDDESIVRGEWTDEQGLKIIGLKPGETYVTIQADLKQVKIDPSRTTHTENVDGTTTEDQVAEEVENFIAENAGGNKIPPQKLSIRRKVKVISGLQETAPFTKGPNLLDIQGANHQTTTQAYIGDKLNFMGEGFSKSPENYQNIYFGAAPGFNDQGLAPKFHQELNEYRSFEIEVPDALTGNVKVAVGRNQTIDVAEEEIAKWFSNEKGLTILEPRLDYAHPTAIIGEAWPILGQGFSHTGKYNTAYFGQGTTTPILPNKENPIKAHTLPPEEITEVNHTELIHSLHQRLDFIVPETATSGNFYTNVIDALNTINTSLIVQSFKNQVVVSEPSRSAIRPTVVIDKTTGDQLVAWIDRSLRLGNQLVISKLPAGSAQLGDTKIISENIGGLAGAPAVPAIAIKGNEYFAAWIGKVNDNDELLISTSTDLENWSAPVNVSDSPEVTTSPGLAAGDFDHDGDTDLAVVYTEHGAKENIPSQVMLAFVENRNGTYEKNYDLKVSGNGGGDDGCIDFFGGILALAYSEDFGSKKEDTFKRDIFVRTMTMNGFAIENPKHYNLSKNQMADSVARYPKVKIDQANKLVYAVWESTGENRFEDIYFAGINLINNEAGEKVNVSKSTRHSQKPALDLDGDNTPAISWVEVGYDYAKDTDANKMVNYDTELVFARSFDQGKSFNSPYMRLTDADTRRLGHPALAGWGDARYTVVWQEENNNGTTSIKLKSTENQILAPESFAENSVAGGEEEYIVRTYDEEIPDHSFTNDPRSWFDGDVVISDLNGNNMRKITRTEGVTGRASYSPDGTQIAYADKKLYIAEGDGAHPIARFNVEYAKENDDNRVYNAAWSPSGNYISFNVRGEMHGAAMGGYDFVQANSVNDRANCCSGVIEVGHGVWPENGNDSLLVNYAFEDTDPETNDSGLSIIDPGNGIIASRIPGDLGDTAASFSPDGEKIVYVATERTNEWIDNQYAIYGDIYLMDANGLNKEKIYGDKPAYMPIFSPDGNKVVFVARTDGKDQLMVIDLTTDDKTARDIPGIEADKKEFMPIFMKDGKRLILNAGTREAGLGLKVVDIETGEVSYISQSSGYSGPATILSVKAPGIMVPGTVTVMEDDDVGYAAVLNAKPTGEVTLEATTADSIINIINKTVLFTEDNWNIPQYITVAGVDNNLLEGERTGTVTYSVYSIDPSFDGVPVRNTLVKVLEDELPDTTKPVWPQDQDFNYTMGNNGTEILLSWKEALDNASSDKECVSGIKEYILDVVPDIPSFASPQMIAAGTTSCKIEGLALNWEYRFTLQAIDVKGNLSEIIELEARLNDTTPPMFGNNDEIEIEKLTSRTVEISWPEAYDNVGVQKYVVNYGPGQEIDTVNTAANLENLEPGYAYTIKVTAYDAAGNAAQKVLEKVITTPIKNPFTAGAGYHEGGYEAYADAPLALGWSRQSRFNGPEGYGAKFILENPSGVTPVISADGTIYVCSWEAGGTLKAINPDGTIKWTKSNIGSAFDSPMIGKDGTIYVVTQENILKAFNQDGTAKFIKTADSGEYFFNLIGLDENGRIFVMADENAVASAQRYIIYVLDANGDKSWKHQFHEKISIPVIAEDSFEGILYFKGNNYIYGYRKEDGVLRMTENTAPLEYSGMFRAIYQNTLYLYNNYLTKAKLTAYDKSSKIKLWEYELASGTITSDAAVDQDGTIYFGASTGTIYAVSKTGAVEWSYSSNAAITSAPIVDFSGNIYFTNDHAKLYKLNQSGIKEWDTSLTKGSDAVTISAPQIDANGTLYINADDSLFAISNTGGETAAFEQIAYTVDETVAAISIPVSLDQVAHGVRIIKYRVSGGTAAQDTDYTVTEGELIFEAGAQTKNIMLNIVNDTASESDETIVLELEGVLGGVLLGNTLMTTITINDDDAGKEVGFQDQAVDVDENAGNIEIVVIRRGPTDAVSFNFATKDGSAQKGIDYTPKAGTLLFGVGETSKTITVAITDNATYQEDRSFSMMLTDLPDGYQMFGDPINITIKEDEEIGQIELEKMSYTVNENAGTLEVKVNRTQYEDCAAQVFVEVSHELSTAVRGTDFDIVNGLLEFAKGEHTKTLTIDLIDDLLEEGNEAFQIYLNAPTGVVLKTGKSVAVITIIDDESTVTPPTVSQTTESGIMDITITGIQGGDQVRLYKMNQGIPELKRGPDNMGGTEYHYQVNIAGDYYVTREVGGVESAPSETLTLAEPPPVQRVGDVSASISLAKGTDVGTTKISISNLGGHLYYYQVTTSANLAPFPNTPYGQLTGEGYLTALPEAGIDNITITAGEYLNIIEVDGPDMWNVGVGFRAVQITANEIN